MDMETDMSADIHQRGAARFGTLWLAINQQIVDICYDQGIRVWEEPWRTVLPLLAFEWCDDITQAEQHSAQSGGAQPAVSPPVRPRALDPEEHTP